MKYILLICVLFIGCNYFRYFKVEMVDTYETGSAYGNTIVEVYKVTNKRGGIFYEKWYYDVGFDEWRIDNRISEKGYIIINSLKK